MSEQRQLFGGAIETLLQSQFVDVSKVRQVPDHQEVFIDQDSECSLIIELLEFESSLPNDTSAIHHYFNDLAEANESTEKIVLSEGMLSGDVFIPSLDGSHCKMALIGKQRVGKYRTRPDMQVDEIYVVLVLVRLTNVGTDLLISLNIPTAALQAAGEEPALAEWETSVDIAHLIESAEIPASAVVGAQKFYEFVSVIRGAAHTLVIKDWTLFKN